MSVATERRAGTVILAAPIAGRVRLHPPKTLCGELEVFEGGETIADVDGSARIEAPVRGFVVRAHVADGARVAAGAPVATFSVKA
jgi:hypothetical protein